MKRVSSSASDSAAPNASPSAISARVAGVVSAHSGGDSNGAPGGKDGGESAGTATGRKGRVAGRRKGATDGEQKFPMEVRIRSSVVKIYKVVNKGRTSFTLAYYSKGRRKLAMFAALNDALAEANAKVSAMERGEVDVVPFASEDRMAYSLAMDALKPTAVALVVAAEEYAAAFKILGGRASLLEAAREFARRSLHTLPDKMVPDAVAEMLAARKQDGTGEAYQKVLRIYLGQFAESFRCQVRSVTPAQIGDFLRSLPIAPRSRNNARATLGAFLKFCKERGWLPRDHEGIALVPKAKEVSGEIEIFTPTEMRWYMRAARPELVPFLAIGGFAGLRSMEIERLDWSEVHLADRFIEVKAAKAKTASRRIVPITENLAAWLADHARPEGPVLAFKNMGKQIGWLVEATAAAMAREREKETGRTGGKSGSVPELEWKKNALRHSFISYRVAAIQNVNQVALEAGNSAAMIFKHYRELVRPAAAQEWFGIVPEKTGTTVEA